MLRAVIRRITVRSRRIPSVRRFATPVTQKMSSSDNSVSDSLKEDVVQQILAGVVTKQTMKQIPKPFEIKSENVPVFEELNLSFLKRKDTEKKELSEEQQESFLLASSPRRATADDIPTLSKLMAESFVKDPIFDYITVPSERRLGALQDFFGWLLTEKALSHNNIWMSDNAKAVAAWMPPNADMQTNGVTDQIRLLPLALEMCGLSRLGRFKRLLETLDRTHPREPHFYCAFMAVAGDSQGLGLGGAIMKATLREVDLARMPAYLENSNPKNTALYEKYGFVITEEIKSEKGAPPLIGMWRKRADIAGKMPVA